MATTKPDETKPKDAASVSPPPPTTPPTAGAPAQALPILPPPENIDDLAWSSLGNEDTGSFVSNAERGYVYSWIRPADYAVDGRELRDVRQRLVTRGWEARTGPLAQSATNPELIPGRPDLEIWRMSQARWDNEWRVDMARHVLDQRSAERYWRHHVKQEAPGRGRGGLPKNVEDAMLAYHGLVVFPGKPTPPTREQLIAMVRRMPVHPGKEPTTEAW